MIDIDKSRFKSLKGSPSFQHAFRYQFMMLTKKTGFFKNEAYRDYFESFIQDHFSKSSSILRKVQFSDKEVLITYDVDLHQQLRKVFRIKSMLARRMSSYFEELEKDQIWKNEVYMWSIGKEYELVE